MSPEEREVRREQMQKCLEISMDIWDLLASRNDATPEGDFADVHITEVVIVIRKRFPAPLHEMRQEAIGHSVARALTRYGLTSCGLWDFAHHLDHCLFEDDLSEIEDVLKALG